MSSPIRRGPAIYRQIMDALKASISGGLHNAGDMLPSSTRLAADFHTTRSTVTKALLLLVQAGWIEPRQGIGYFVLPADQRRALPLEAPTGRPREVAAFWWTVPAVVSHVHDGDTVDAELDLGWHLALRTPIRVAHINAPELSTTAGQAAAVFAQQLLPPGTPVMVSSERLDKYGRTLATITLHELWQGTDGRSTADFGTAMLWSGNAVPYEGR